ncbi:MULTISPECIES: VanZ family protein [unclassified Uliginosibacterium]|uniref:VanZ family protein n=1 Tax=unclassified Uliginosibacterium TaxID=2621521 RepID=UPI001C1F4A34|nr:MULTISPECIES: VanZ family protein [unclassified Uliginosibacterium]MDO6388296.1 VanZ family protein [Uliginosibacterium sp. 31-12]
MKVSPRQVLAALVLGLMLLALFAGGAQPEAAGLIPAPWDKLAHLTLFAVLALLLRGGLGLPAWLALLIALGIGAADEFHQAGLPGRFAGLDDWLADLVGALLGLALLRLWGRRTRA